ncbi:ABC transporter permease [Acidobacteriota bacterium]
MFRHIFSFELWYRLKKVSTHIYFAMFFLVGFFGVYRASVGGGLLRKLINAGVGNVNADAPYALFYLITVASHFGILITAAFFANSAFRDFKENSHELYFSYPIRKIDYFADRFFGAMAASLFVFSGVGLGAFLGRLAPFTDVNKVGPVDLWVYIQPYLVSVLPNILFAGALFFSLVLLTRKIFPLYVGVTGLLIFYLVGESLARTRSDFLAALIDPFGKLAAQGFYEYWTAAQKNILLIPLSGDFLINRVLWSGLAVALLIFTYRKFRLSYMLESGPIRPPLSGFRFDNQKFFQKSPPHRRRPVSAIITVERLFGFKSHIRQIFSASLHEFRVLVKNTYFLIILFLGTAFIFILGFRNVGLVRGTQTHPVTSQVLASTKMTLYLFSLLLILFCSGELIWRERSKKVDQIYDVLPVPTWVPFSGKLGALILVQVLMVTIIMFAGIIIQVLHGYTHFELGLYIKELFGIRLVYYCLISVLAMFIQVLVNKKFLGFVITFLLVDDLLPTLGFEHHLWRFASVPDYVYSDINGYGTFAQGIFFFNLYWIAFALILILLAVLFRVRGKDTGLTKRIRKAKERLTRRKLLADAAALLSCIFFGGYIVYNTNILNRFESRQTTELNKVEYEKKYKKYETMPRPQVIDIKLDVDIYPYRRRVVSKGRMILKNKTEAEVTRLFIQGPEEGKINHLRLQLPCTLTESAGNHSVYIYRLDKPVQPGEEILLEFEIELQQKGFKNHYSNSTWRSLYTRLVHNGTFLYVFDVIPAIGYDPYFTMELADNDKRKKYGLQPKEIIASIHDAEAGKQSPVGKDAYRVNYEAVVSTAVDQTALTSGELIKEWQEGDRRYFHYRTRGKILKYFSFLSAKYCVKKDK